MYPAFTVDCIKPTKLEVEKAVQVAVCAIEITVVDCQRPFFTWRRPIETADGNLLRMKILFGTEGGAADVTVELGIDWKPKAEAGGDTNVRTEF